MRKFIVNFLGSINPFKIKIMKLIQKSLIFSLLSIVVLSSCDLLGGEVSEPSKAETRPGFNSSYSVLWALNTKTSVSTSGLGMDINDMQVDFGTAFAAFTDGGNNVAAGDVKVNDISLKMEKNKFYMSPISVTNPTGITFEGTAKWSVAGANNIPAVNYTTKKSFPSATGFTCDATVDKTKSYSISLTSVSNADSILYMVNDVVKTVAGNVKSVSFTSDQLSALKKGNAFVQVAPYNYEIKLFGSKNFVFGNQIVFSKLVTIK